MLDIMTLVVMNLMLSLIGAGAMAIIWKQNRHRFAGMFFWFVSMIAQAVSTILLALRGTVPDFISIVVSNTLVAAGVVFLLLGLESFVGRKGPRIPIYILLTVYAVLMTYFYKFQPDINMREILVSAMILLIAAQICWLLFRRVPPDLKKITRITGTVVSGYIFISAARIILALIYPMKSGDYFESGQWDSLVVSLYAGITCCLIISLILLVNRRLFQQVQAQEQKYTMAFHSSPYAIMLTRLSDGGIFEVNDGFVNTTGYSYAEVMGKTTHQLGFWVREEDRIEMVEELLRNKSVKGLELQFRKKSGEIFYGIYTANILVLNGEECILANISDITEISTMKQKLQMLATHDALTQLPNRLLLYDRFSTAMASAARNNKKVAVMSVDVDNFKAVNDSKGHLVGDQALIAVAQRLSGLLRRVDTVARFGGDEFILLLGEIGKQEDAFRSTDEILKEFHKPFIIGSNTLSLNLSIGISFYPDDGSDMDDLMKKSDEALYFVKENGRDNYQLYDRIKDYSEPI